jgi:nicotinamide-nucleotide amidase
VFDKIPFAGIICVGTELTRGIIQDKNAEFLSSSLNKINIKTNKIAFLPDDETIIRNELVYFINKYSLVFVTGGLGPTSDDLTRDAVAKIAGEELLYREDVWEDLRKRFGNRKISASNKKQALIPSGFSIIPNPNGTAVGFCGKIGKSFIFVFPGPPREMVPMFQNDVYQFLISNFKIADIEELSATSFMVPESELEDSIADAASDNLKWNTRIQDYRITFSLIGASEEERNSSFNKIVDKLGKYRIKRGDCSPSQGLFDTLKKNQLYCAFAESCTAGLATSLITEIPGSSEVLWGGVTVYSNNAKIKLLGISPHIINEYGAVSREVAAAMALGVSEVSGAHIGIGITGIAGPGGGTETKPVGTVWIAAVAPGKGELIKQYSFSGDRSRIRRRSAVGAHLLGEEVIEKVYESNSKFAI